MPTDFIMNGEGFGDVGQALLDVDGDSGLMRPYFNEVGQRCVTMTTGKVYNKEKGKYLPKLEEVLISDVLSRGVSSPVLNSTSLRKDEWITLSQAVVKAARKRLRAWSDLAASSTETLDGMSSSIYEYETESDPGEAVVDMDALSEGNQDSHKYQLEGLPLPITHDDFFFSMRRIKTSRKMGRALDVARAESAGRRVAEMIEKTVIGVTTGITYGNTALYSRAPTVYGYTNFPDRITKTDMTQPTGSNGTVVKTEWLEVRELLYNADMYGPYMAYVSSDWDQYLDNLFSTTEPSAGSLRKNLLDIGGIQDIRRLDYLNGTSKYDVIFVQMDGNTAKAIVGMPLNTVQWPDQGGFRRNFKVLTIQAPNLRADFNGNCGIAHATIS